MGIAGAYRRCAPHQRSLSGPGECLGELRHRTAGEVKRRVGTSAEQAQDTVLNECFRRGSDSLTGRKSAVYEILGDAL